MRLYDTKSRKKREFEPVEAGKVKMYVCGPTVYNRIHIGNARTFINFDVIRRYLEYRGYEVTFVSNLTDIDDKIINKANEEGRSTEEVVEEFAGKFIDIMHEAGVKDPTVRPRATQEIPEMIELIETLIANGNAYEVEGDVYFSVETDKTYGCLSGRTVEGGESGHRSLVAEGQGIEDRKRAEADFALWKASKPGEPSWDSPWGPGRPGWHTECVCMSKKYLGIPFDIHGGGSDLVFPHHENEIAQAECAWHQGFANYWMHSGMLNVDNEKMSKSLGNFLMLDDLLETVSADDLRMLTLQTHYRSPLNFSQDRLVEAGKALSNIKNCANNIEWLIDAAQCEGSGVDNAQVRELVDKCKDAFIEDMDDDFNAPAAAGEIAILCTALNKVYSPSATLSNEDVETAQYAHGSLEEMMNVFGISLSEEDSGSGEIPAEIKAICDELGVTAASLNDALDSIVDIRAKARADKDWGTADKIRDLVAQAGWLFEDTAQGTKIKKM